MLRTNNLLSNRTLLFSIRFGIRSLHDDSEVPRPRFDRSQMRNKIDDIGYTSNYLDDGISSFSLEHSFHSRNLIADRLPRIKNSMVEVRGSKYEPPEDE